MKSLQTTIVAIATSLLIVCTSFSAGRPDAGATRPATKAPYYYWYLASDNSYQGYCPVTSEEAALENMYGVFVDNNPSGGTLLAGGYFLKGYPHSIPASVNLYGHF